MTKKTKSARLRELIAKGAIMLPGVPNAAMARQVERLGFDAVYVSGAGMANATAGVPDIGLLTLTEVVQLAGYIAKAVKIPAIVDADTGFGGSENVARTIRDLEAVGLAGCHIEDQEFPKRCGHLSGSVAKRTGISRFCQRDPCAVVGKHDGVWEKPAAFVYGVGRIWLPHGYFPPKRVPRVDESDRGVSACSQRKRDPKGMAR